MKARYELPRLKKSESEMLYVSAANDAARSVIAACLLAMHRQGKGAEEIRQMYEDILSVLDQPEVFGRKMEDIEVRAMIADDYGIDFERVRLTVSQVTPAEMARKEERLRKEKKTHG